MKSAPTRLGTVEDVKGSTISVAFAEEASSGLAFVDGTGYRIGQIGSFVRIPIGFIDLFGIVSQVGASAVPERLAEIETHGHRWMTVQIVGEGARNGEFKRGLSQYPVIGDHVHLVTENDLRRIYGHPDSTKFISIGHIASAESISAAVDINALVTRHSAIVGSTGSGKSTTVAGLLHRIANSERFPSARILVFDIHGEYAKAFQGISNVFKINPSRNSNEKKLLVPYWALNFEELLTVAFGAIDNDADRGGIIEEITKYKLEALAATTRPGVTVDNLNVDTPVPFSIHKLWLDLYKLILANHTGTSNQTLDTVAYQQHPDGTPIDTGDALSVKPPKFLPIDQSSGANPKVYRSQSPLNIRRQLEGLAYKLRDSRYDFIFRPGDWMPDDTGNVAKDIDALLEQWLGGEHPITVLDLSGIPRDILNVLVGALVRILFDSLFWARNLSEGGRERPLLLVLEEAHAYLSGEKKSFSTQAVRRVVKEGRKYGIGCMLVSQRPVEIDATILSQCGTFFAMRLANNQDRAQITSTVPDNLEGLFSLLPILRTGEAIIVGEAVQIPMRATISLPPNECLPDSQDPIIHSQDDEPGGWNRGREVSNYMEVVELWRRQNPTSSSIINLDHEEQQS